MMYAIGFIGSLVAVILLWEWYKSYQARAFAGRHGLNCVRGSIDAHTPLRGFVNGVVVGFEPERVNVGRRARESRVVVTLEKASKDLGVLQRWKSGAMELSVSTPTGCMRADISKILAQEYELFLPAGNKHDWSWLKNNEAINVLRGFRSLRRIQFLGTSSVLHVRGDLGDVMTMERIWKLLEVMTHMT